MNYKKFTLSVPNWVEDFLKKKSNILLSAEEKMALVIELSALSVENGGGPFGAAIFDRKTHGLIAPGVNMVVQMNCSVMHAEMMAIMIAQQEVNSFDLASSKDKSYELVTSSEPCAQCFGAIPWSGLSQVVYGANSHDVESIGFDEGPKPQNWKNEFNSRGINVIQEVLREEAVRVLSHYKKLNLRIY